MFVIALILLLLIAGSGILCLFACKHKVFEDRARDVLIFAAHSDDCVIVGAEYACYAIAFNCTVHIIYLTCSGPDAEAEISQNRKNEALTAWSILGISADKLKFIELNSSAPGGPPRYSTEEIEIARHVFKSSILTLPKDAAIIVPAFGESNIDHRSVRQLALEALRESQRTDLIIYESPEYNNHLSLLRAPERTLRTFLLHIPLSTRVIAPYLGSTSYVNGSMGRTFGNPAYLAKKKEMLMHFESQDGKKLIRFFGHPTPYRVLNLSNATTSSEHEAGFRVFSHVCDFSALAWGAGLGGFIFCIAYAVGDYISHLLSRSLSFDMPIALLGVLCAFSYVVMVCRKRASIATALLMSTAGLGWAIGVILN